MNRYASCQDELLMFSYLCGTVYVSSFCLLTGDLYEGAVFLRHEVRVEQMLGKKCGKVWDGHFAMLAVVLVMLVRLVGLLPLFACLGSPCSAMCFCMLTAVLFLLLRGLKNDDVCSAVSSIRQYKGSLGVVLMPKAVLLL